MPVWKAYGMGPGKKTTFLKLNLPTVLQTASLSPRCSAEAISAQFCTVKSRRAASNQSVPEGKVQGIPSTSGCGRRVRSLEQKSMIDKAVRGYAARLEGQFAGVRQFEE